MIASRYWRVLFVIITTTLLLSLFSPTKGLLQSKKIATTNSGLIESTRNRNHYGWFGTRNAIPSSRSLASLANGSNDAVLDEALDPVTKAEVRRVANYLAKQTLESILSPSDVRAMTNELFFENNSKSTILNDASYLQYVKLCKKIEDRLRKEDKRTPVDLLGKELTDRILSSIRGDGGRRGNYDPQTVLTFLESDAINSLLTKLLYDAIFEFTMKIDILGNAISSLPLLGPVRNQVLKESKRNMDRTLGPLLQRFLSGYTRVATRQAVDFMVSEENASSFGKANVRLVSYLLEKRTVADWLPDESLLAEGREEVWKYLVGLESGDGNVIIKDDQKKIVEQGIEWMYNLAGDKSIEDVGLNINDILDASPTLERSLGKFWHTCLTASK